MDLQEKVQRVQKFRLIDDVFFEVFAKDIPACQEILRTILEDVNLTVQDVIVQSSERNLYGRSVRLDALCTLGSGIRCNIEVQRMDNDDHLKRARFNASSITVRESQTGEKYKGVVTLYIVYISEFDFLKEGLTVYHVDKTIRETGTTVDDGLHEIFVNTAVDYGSNIAELMKCFKAEMVSSTAFPAVTRRFQELKSERGVSTMCKIMEECLEEERTRERISAIQRLIKKGFDKSLILELEYSEDEYKEAESKLMTLV